MFMICELMYVCMSCASVCGVCFCICVSVCMYECVYCAVYLLCWMLEVDFSVLFVLHTVAMAV